MNSKILCLVAILAVHCLAKPLKTTRIIKAINCGLREGFTKGDADFKYESDQPYISGSSVDVDYHSDANAVAADIKYTMEKEIYMFERHTYSQMVYTLPVKTGKHTLIMKFAQMYFQKEGQRVFDIKIGDKVVIANFDVIQKSGARYAAHEEYLEFEVKDGAVYVNGVKVPNGLKGGNIQVSFAKGKADNPIIQAIILYQGPVEQTTKAEYEVLKKNWGSHSEMIKAKKENEKVKELIAMTKKRERIIIRNDQLLIEEQKGQAEEAPRRDKFGTIRSFLMGPIGIIAWAAFFGWAVFVLYNKVFLMGGSSTDVGSVKNE